MRHSDLIGIRKAKGKADIHILPLFDNAPHFTADILRRFLRLQQQRFDFR